MALQTNLILRNTKYFNDDVVKGSVLSFKELDDNFSYLKGETIYSATTSGSTVTLHKLNNDAILFAVGSSGDTYLISGSTSGNTLYLERNDGGIIEVDLSPSMSGAVLYTNSAATYVDVGGIEDGSTFSAVTMQDMWTDLLYPNLNPSFTTFKMDTYYGFSLDIGEEFSGGNRTFEWETVNSGFIQTDTVKILDATNGYAVLGSGLTNDGEEILDIGSNITKTSRKSNRWVIYAQKMNNTWFGRSLYANWYWNTYWGGNTNGNLTATQLTGLTNNLLTDEIDKDYSFSANSSYKYLVIPVVSGWRPVAGNPHHYWYGKRPEYIKDVSTNLNIALAGPSDGYTDTVNDAVIVNPPATYPNATNDLPCKLMDITNPFGYVIRCYVFRSKYMLGGAITMKVE